MSLKHIMIGCFVKALHSVKLINVKLRKQKSNHNLVRVDMVQM